MAHTLQASPLPQPVADAEPPHPVTILDPDDVAALDALRASLHGGPATPPRRASKRPRSLSPAPSSHHERISWRLRSRPIFQAVLARAEDDVNPPSPAVRRAIDLAARARPVPEDPRIPWFDLLPDDMVLAVFAHLPLRDRVRVSAVCHRWHRLAWEPVLFQEIDFAGMECVDDTMLSKLCADPRTLSRTRSLALRKCHGVSDAAVRAIATSGSALLLERLDLSWCSGATDYSVAEFARCGKLKELILAHNRGVTRKSLKGVAVACPQLEVLDLTCCNGIRDTLLNMLGTYCHKLRELNLTSATYVTNDGLRELVKRCRRLERLDLSWCTKIGDGAVIPIAENLENLVEIGLSETHLTNRGLMRLVERCRKLQIIHLARCLRISDDGIESIEANLSGTLTQLNLASCHEVNDSAIVSLMSKCRLLKCLDVSKLPCRELTEALKTFAEPLGIQVFH